MLDLIFYSFAGLAVISAILVVSSKNPVHSVLFLILVFSLSAGVLLLLNTEFLAIVYVVVYVGAIAVLFLFVVMMLNMRITSNSIGKYMPIGLLIGSIVFFQLYFIVEKELPNYPVGSSEYVQWGDSVQYVMNVEALSEVLYTYYVYFFILAGMVLFVAMLGAIVLTLHHKADVRRQEVYAQVGRNYTTGIVKVDLRKEL